jgi:hypothetical protein
VRDDRDELLDRIVGELKVLPAVPADATARVLARVDAARRGQAPGADADDDDVIFFPTATDEMQTVPAASRAPSATPVDAGAGRGGWRRRFVVSIPVAIGYALAATVAGFLIRGAMPRSGGDATVATEQQTQTDARAVPVTAVAGLTPREYQEAPVAVQFVLDAQRAKSVALVGDFNAWAADSMPLVRDSATGVWSTVVNVTPGRHVYAFVVDGEVWTLDPRAPKTKDADYGTEQSVIIVGLR